MASPSERLTESDIARIEVMVRLAMLCGKNNPGAAYKYAEDVTALLADRAAQQAEITRLVARVGELEANLEFANRNAEKAIMRLGVVRKERWQSRLVPRGQDRRGSDLQGNRGRTERTAAMSEPNKLDKLKEAIHIASRYATAKASGDKPEYTADVAWLMAELAAKDEEIRRLRELLEQANAALDHARDYPRDLA